MSFGEIEGVSEPTNSLMAEVFETATLPARAQEAIFSPWVVRLPGGYLAGTSSEESARQIADGYNEIYGGMTPDEVARIVMRDINNELSRSFGDR
jgi:hypothetical protein